MKIEFDEYNFIEMVKSENSVRIILSARDSEDSLKTTINSVLLTEEQFMKLVLDLELSILE